MESGQSVSANEAVIVLSDRLIIKAVVDETDIGKVKIGRLAIISLDAYPTETVGGKVTHIAYESRIVNNVIMYEVDIIPDRTPSVFRSGMSANVDITENSRDNVLLIPLKTVKGQKRQFCIITVW